MASRTRRFFLNTISLCASALIMRGVGVAFNIYVSSRAGTVAMGLYSLIIGVYGFFITLGACGINLGVTRLVSEALGNGDIALAKKSIRVCLIFCAVSGLIASAILFFMSPYIASNLLCDTRCEISLRAMSLSLLPIAICSCLSGYFTAVRRVRLNSALSTAIQIFKIFITITLLFILMPYGEEYACLALVLGMTVCEILLVCVSGILFLIDKRKYLKAVDTAQKPTKKICKKLMGITIPVTVASCLRSLLASLSHILIPLGLKKSGSSWSAALSSYGLICSVVLPLILFPSAFISSFSGLLIPEVSECRVQGDTARLKRIAYRILTLSLFFSIGVAGIMTFLASDIGFTVYKSAEAGDFIRILAPLIPIMYIDSAVDAMLKGMGKQVYSMIVNIIDAGTACIIIFIFVPKFGIYGYILSIYVTEILNTTLSLIGMIRCISPRLRAFHQVFLPTICICGATCISNIILNVINHPFSPAIELIFHISLVVILYAVLLLLTRAIGRDEKEVLYQSLIPKNQKKDGTVVPS